MGQVLKTVFGGNPPRKITARVSYILQAIDNGKIDVDKLVTKLNRADIIAAILEACDKKYGVGIGTDI